MDAKSNQHVRPQRQHRAKPHGHHRDRFWKVHLYVHRVRSWIGSNPVFEDVTLVDAMKERGLLPLPAAPPRGDAWEYPSAAREGEEAPNGSVCRKTVCGNRSAPTPDGDRPDHRSW